MSAIGKIMTFKKKIIRTIQMALLLGMLIAGGYPKVSDAWNRYLADQRIDHYTQTNAQDPTALQEEYEKAKEYNVELYNAGFNHIAEYTQRLSHVDGEESENAADGSTSDGLSFGTTDDPAYTDRLNTSGDGLMAILDIEKIGVHLPIYHFSSDDVLAKGIGHLYGSSLPVGGANSRCVLTGHRGLPEMELFTNLDQMEKGDMFSIQVLDQTHYYQVSDIQVINPDELDTLAIEPGKDLVTLVTCTPYGVNTQRLLVTGTRVKTPAQAKQSPTQTVKQIAQFPVTILAISGIILVLFAIGFIVVWTSKTEEEE